MNHDADTMLAIPAPTESMLAWSATEAAAVRPYRPDRWAIAVGALIAGAAAVLVAAAPLFEHPFTPPHISVPAAPAVLAAAHPGVQTRPLPAHIRRPALLPHRHTAN